MQISNSYAQWDIVVVPFPYTDQQTVKRRPALVVSKPWTIKQQNLIWVMMITSATDTNWSGDVAISNLLQAGLSTPSIIRSMKIATIEAHIALRKLGSLANVEQQIVQAAIQQILL